jgi:hypothetical protein
MSLQSTSVSVPNVGSRSLQIVAVDERPEVLSGDKTPQWIGLQRAGFGIPYGVHTESGKPLAEELGNSLAQSFRRSGASPEVNAVPLRGNLETVPFSKDRALVLRIKKWKSDTMTNVNFTYHLEASVQDRSRKVLAKNAVEGNDSIDGSFWNPVGASERRVTAKQREILERLVNAPQIVAALR